MVFLNFTNTVFILVLKKVALTAKFSLNDVMAKRNQRCVQHNPIKYELQFQVALCLPSLRTDYVAVSLVGDFGRIFLIQSRWNLIEYITFVNIHIMPWKTFMNIALFPVNCLYKFLLE